MTIDISDNGLRALALDLKTKGRVQHLRGIRAIRDEAIRQEREECAKLAEIRGNGTFGQNIAADIRARSEP